MNIYIRYFNREAFVGSIDEALEFLSSIPEITLDDDMEADLRAYVAGNFLYPKRYKVRPRAYFIVIKTSAPTLEDFKQKKALGAAKEAKPAHAKSAPVSKMAGLMEIRDGWYDGQLNFKRMVQKPQTNKFEYRDTHVEYRCKALSGMDCYNRIVDYVRRKVNERSQFPSAKGPNFKFEYLGKCK